MSESIGALWIHDKQDGSKYLSGNIDVDGRKVEIVIFKNTFKKEGEKTPDYRIFPKKQREDF